MQRETSFFLPPLYACLSLISLALHTLHQLYSLYLCMHSFFFFALLLFPLAYVHIERGLLFYFLCLTWLLFLSSSSSSYSLLLLASRPCHRTQLLLLLDFDACIRCFSILPNTSACKWMIWWKNREREEREEKRKGQEALVEISEAIHWCIRCIQWHSMCLECASNSPSAILSSSCSPVLLSIRSTSLSVCISCTIALACPVHTHTVWVNQKPVAFFLPFTIDHFHVNWHSPRASSSHNEIAGRLSNHWSK